MTFPFFRLQCTILLVLLQQASAAVQFPGGLLFVGDHPGFRWGTTLHLSPDSTLVIPGNSILQFDFAIWNASQYGTILTLDFGDRRYLMLTLVPDDKGDSASVTLAWHGGTAEAKATLSRSSLGRGKWHLCQLELNVYQGSTTLEVDSAIRNELRGPPITSPQAEIRFGYEPLQKEAALFALRNVKMLRREDAVIQLVNWWPLQESDGSKARDRVGGRDGLQSQGKWLLPLHGTWTIEREFGPFKDSTAYLIFDESRERFLLVTRDTLFSIDRLDSSVQRLSFITPHKGRSHRVLYDERRNRLFTFHDGGGHVTAFSFIDRTWPEIDSTTEWNQHHYDCLAWVDPKRGDLWMFGGYGWYSAQNTFSRYDFRANEWIAAAVYGDTIPPRYAAAMAMDKTGRIYIAGGRGNLNGKQQSGFYEFFDLWQFDPAKRNVRHVWTAPYDLDHGITSIVPAEDDSSFYFLVRKDSVEEDGAVAYQTVVSYPSLQRSAVLRMPPHRWRSNIYLDRARGQLIFIAEYMVHRNEFSFSVYTLELPPVPGDAFQSLLKADAPRHRAFLVVLTVTAGTLVLAWFLWKRTRQRKSTRTAEREVSADGGNLPGLFTRIEVLGGFHLYDSEGRDLVHQMRRQVSQLFAVLLVHSLPGHGGVSAEKLTTIFWPGIDPRSARNSRNVAMKNLRDVLASAGITILYTDDHYSLHWTTDIECDFYKLTDTLARITDSESEISELLVKRFLTLAGKQQLLPGKDYEWLEAVRTALMCDVTRAAGVLLKGSRLRNGSAPHLLEIAEVALLWDPLNEAAMRAKLKKLAENGLHSEAKADFERFAGHYQATFHRPYPGTIQNVLQG